MSYLREIGNICDIIDGWIQLASLDVSFSSFYKFAVLFMGIFSVLTGKQTNKTFHQRQET